MFPGYNFPYTESGALNMDWIIQFIAEAVEEWKTTQKDWANMQEAFNSLKSYVENYFANLDVQEEINNKLEDMLDSGELADIINSYFFGYITKEEDFDLLKDKLFWVMKNSVTITKPIEIDGVKYFNGYGYTITVTDDFQGTEVFHISKNDDYETSSRAVKKIQNVRVFFNPVTTIPTTEYTRIDIFKVWYFRNVHISGMQVENAHGTFFTYNDENIAMGAECSIEDIQLYKDVGIRDDSLPGFRLRFTDLYVKALEPVFYATGIIVEKGPITLYTCHPWGYPITTDLQYPISAIMHIGFYIKSSNVTLVGCISDTAEPVNTDLDPSFTNGGIHYYVWGHMQTLLGCGVVAHNLSYYKKHIGYYITGKNPESSGDLWSSNISLVGCSCALNATLLAQFSKQLVIDGDNFPCNVIASALDDNHVKYVIQGSKNSRMYNARFYDTDFNFRISKQFDAQELYFSGNNGDFYIALYKNIPYNAFLPKLQTLATELKALTAQPNNTLLSTIYVDSDENRKPVFWDAGSKHWIDYQGTVIV